MKLNSNYTTTPTTTTSNKQLRYDTHYELTLQIGQGTYGEVWKGYDRESKQVVALKKIKMEQERDGFPQTAIREIKILKAVSHVNIVHLIEIVTSQDNSNNTSKSQSDPAAVYMVFEYMEHDLDKLIRKVRGLDTTNFLLLPHVKCYMQQLLLGLEYLHSNRILHRDIKAANLLINNQGRLKLADFGLARALGPSSQDISYTNKVITLWYRPPELLLGAIHYGPAIDVWSAGCILAELLMKEPLFKGQDRERTEVEQLQLIWDLVGTPTEKSWPTVSELPWYKAIQPIKPLPNRLRSFFYRTTKKNLPKDALNLLTEMLQLDPKSRISCSDALKHEFFTSDPQPASPSSLPHYPSSHEEHPQKVLVNQQHHHGGNSKNGQHKHDYQAKNEKNHRSEGLPRPPPPRRGVSLGTK